MRKIVGMVLGSVLLAGCASAPEVDPAQAYMVQLQIDKLLKEIRITPGRKGLLPTAQAEAKTAATHAAFAAEKPTNLVWMQAHIEDVLHAVDPTVVDAGPGLGFGVKQAAEGAIKYANIAAATKGASKGVKTHAVHVTTSAKNVVTWSKLIVRIAKKVKAAKSAKAAAGPVKKIAQLAKRLNPGDDANGDGKVIWSAAEGGLNEAAKHAGFMSK
jgi:hypothetical protein